MSVICPIAYWKTHQSNAFALAHLTYHQLDELIQSLCAQLTSIPSSIIAFIPKGEALDVALFFAAWRVGKSIYPLSHRLPKKAIEKRLKLTRASFVIPTLSNNRLDVQEIDPNLIATLIETSSQTKIACHKLNALFAGAKEAILTLEITPSSTYCLNLPLSHIAGIATILRTFLAGGHLIYKTKEATHLSMVPTQLIRLDRPLPKCQCLLVGGAPLGEREYQAALEKGLPIHLTYGMTEIGSMAALKKPHEKTTILPHVCLKLNSDGEILLKGTSLFEGYFGREKQRGWFATNDLATYQDEELIILGRKDRQFISGGENIQPEEIEKVLCTIDGIIQAKVTPKTDVEFGQIPTACIFAKRPIDLKELTLLLEKRLPRFKIPKTIEWTKEPLKSLKMANEPLGKGH